MEADLNLLNHKHDQECRDKNDALERIKNLEQVVDKVIDLFVYNFYLVANHLNLKINKKQFFIYLNRIGRK